VPVALLGLLGYLAIVGSTLRAGPTAAVVGMLVALVGAAFSVYLLAVQAFVLDAYCAWCLVSDALMIVLAVLTTLRAVRSDE
jgi:uncharacterized membrane protein